MWNEWLARTLKRPRVPAAGATTRAPVPMQREETGMDDVRPSTRALARAAQDEEVKSLVADIR
jgi:hypothetical protein